MNHRIIPALLALTFVSTAHAAPAWVAPVYGNDDRQEVYEVRDPAMRLRAESSVALVRSSKLKLDANPATPGFFSYEPHTVQETTHLCGDEPYSQQPALANCSGVLVGADLVLTAGHCVESIDDCRTMSFVFGYGINHWGQPAPSAFAAADVYQCGEIVARERELGGVDFAVIKLDRAVSGRKPLEINRDPEPLAVGTSLFMIGYPLGMPVKIAEGGEVLGVDTERFRTNLDSFLANSGSPVFNAVTRLVEGILVAGENDFVEDPVTKCQRIRHCVRDECRRGEAAIWVTAASAYIPVPGAPAPTPSAAPSSQPSATPSTQPSATPSSQPSATPSSQPSATPSSQPSARV
jgi:hypothetical protein